MVSTTRQMADSFSDKKHNENQMDFCGKFMLYFLKTKRIKEPKPILYLGNTEHKSTNNMCFESYLN